MAVVERTLPDGTKRWDARWRGPDGKQRQRAFALKRDAQRHLRDQQTAISDGRYVDPAAGRRLLRAVVEEWLTTRTGIRERTRARESIVLDQHILPALGDWPVGRITEADVQDLINAWTGSMAPSTVERSYGVLRLVLCFAARRRFIAEAPLEDISLPQVDPDDSPPLTDREVLAIASAIDPHHRPLVLVMAHTGMRLGEALGLRRRNVDLDRGVIRVAEQLDPDGRTWSTPKTKAGRRSIPLSRAATGALVGQLAGLPADSPVFVGKRGHPLQHSTWRARAWVPAIEAAGVEATPHDLRRYYASCLVADGIDIKTAMARLGHEDPRMLLRLYARLAAEQDRRTADLFDVRLAGAQAPDPSEPGGVVVPFRARRRA